MNELIQSIKNFLLDIQPKLKAAKEAPMNVEQTIEEQITQIGTLEIAEQVMEEVTSLVEAPETETEPMVEVYMSTENSKLAELTSLVEELQSKVTVLETEKETLKAELSKVEQEYKQSFSLTKQTTTPVVDRKAYITQQFKKQK
jgi:hypothetical protein